MSESDEKMLYWWAAVDDSGNSVLIDGPHLVWARDRESVLVEAGRQLQADGHGDDTEFEVFVVPFD